MVGERSPLKIKPNTDSGRETILLSGNGNGRSGHAQKTSRNMIEGDMRTASSQPGSPDARKDQSQITNKNQAHALTRSSSIRSQATRNRDLNNIKKPTEHHYMKTTQCFNAKSKRPINLDSAKVKKKPNPDPHGVRRKSDSILGLQHPKLAESMNPYSKARSRPSSVDSQNTPMLKRSPSINSSRVPRQNRQGIPKPAGNKKYGTKRETEVESFTLDHLSDAENGESVVKEMLKDKNSYLHSDKQEGMLEIVETGIEADKISQNSFIEMELLVETSDFDLSFNPAIISGYNSWEKDILSKDLPDPEFKTKETTVESSPNHLDNNLEVIRSEKVDVISKNITEPEIETQETTMECSPKYPDSNLEVISSKKIDAKSKNLLEPEIKTIETIMEGSPEHPDTNLEVISSEKLDVKSKKLPEPEIKTKETIMKGSPKHPDSNLEVISSEKLDVKSKNLPEPEPEPEIKTKETIIEGSPKHLDSNLEIVTENKILEAFEVTEASISEIEKDAMESFPYEIISRESCEKHEVINTRYDEIDDLCVLSSTNDDTDDLCEISIEAELSKIMGTEKSHCSTQEQKVLPIDIMSTIDEIANELEGMEKDPAGGGGDDMHPTWILKKWKVDYVLQRLIEKLESTDKNNVSKLIHAYETVIALMMRRVAVAVPHQATSQ